MIRFVIAAVWLSAATSVAADATRYPIAMTVANGRCDALIVGSSAVPCGTVVLSLQYSDGRRSLAVKAADGLVSFFGRPDGDGIALEMVTGIRPTQNADKTSTVSREVTGRCTPSALAAKTEIACTATASDGSRYTLSFTTDDKQPDVRSLTK